MLILYLVMATIYFLSRPEPVDPHDSLMRETSWTRMGHPSVLQYADVPFALILRA
jgi:hypothetical protein